MYYVVCMNVLSCTKIITSTSSRVASGTPVVEVGGSEGKPSSGNLRDILLDKNVKSIIELSSLSIVKRK